MTRERGLPGTGDTHDLTTVIALQTTITLFTLTMASLMIPGSKLTGIWGRKRCFLIGLAIYGTGALLAVVAPGLGLMTLGYSLLEGIGSALTIPPIYLLVTVSLPGHAVVGQELRAGARGDSGDRARSPDTRSRRHRPEGIL